MTSRQFSDSKVCTVINDSSPNSKKVIRQRMQSLLNEVKAEEHAAWTRTLLNHLTSDLSWLPENGCVALFGGLKVEPDLSPLIPWLKEKGLDAAYFGMENDALVPYRIQRLDDLVPGQLKVLVPDVSRASRLMYGDLGLILTPGLAFGTSDGSRLGRGRGYYDRLLGHPEFSGACVGVGFGIQHLLTVPTDPHDRHMQRLVSETGWRDIPTDI